MKHVLAIETIVAKLVVHNLVCREIFTAVVFAYESVGSKQKGGLRQLTAMITIFGIANGTNGYYNPYILVAAFKNLYCL